MFSTDFKFEDQPMIRFSSSAQQIKFRILVSKLINAIVMVFKTIFHAGCVLLDASFIYSL